jgi:hypothetical protein
MSSKLKVKVTFYGYPDNDDGENNFGTNIIAHTLPGRYTNEDGDPIAGGEGTSDNPITAATREGNELLPPGTRVYVPHLQKYLIVEDDCAPCDIDEWLDVWMQSNEHSRKDAVKECESNWTGDENDRWEVVIDPPDNLEVDTTPFFNTSTNQCNPVAS